MPIRAGGARINTQEADSHHLLLSWRCLCLMGRRANTESIPGLPRSPLLGKLMAYFLDCSTSLCGSRAFHSSSSDVLQGLMLLNWDGGRVAFHCTAPCTVCPGLIFFSWNYSFQELSTEACLPDLSLCQGAEQLVGLSRLYEGCRVPQHWSLVPEL